MMGTQGETNAPGPEMATPRGGLHLSSHAALIAGLFLGLLFSGCENERLKSGGALEGMEDPWEDYAPPSPSPSLFELLHEAPAIYPHQVCIPLEESMASVEEGYIHSTEDGSDQICLWQHPAGCVPEGLAYPEVAGCDIVRTLGPSWFITPTRKFESELRG